MTSCPTRGTSLKGRLGPGTMICVDLENGRSKKMKFPRVSSARPYGKWLNNIHT